MRRTGTITPRVRCVVLGEETGMNRWQMGVAVVAVVATAAVATDRYYPDLAAVSPNGRFRVTATSPVNSAGDGQDRAFAKDFTYTLTDVVAKRTVWTRAQPSVREKGSLERRYTEGSPMRIFVSDEGEVAAYVAGEDLIVLAKDDGERKARVDILGSFGTKDVKTYVSDTTAGPMWAQRSLWYFLAVPEGEGGEEHRYFVVRPYWHARIVVDLASGERMECAGFERAGSEEELEGASELVRRVLRACVREECERAIAALDAVVAKGLPREWPEYRDAQAALDTVVLCQMRGTEPTLRAVERLIETDSPRGAIWLGPRVSMALRALGEVPRKQYPIGRIDEGGRVKRLPAARVKLAADVRAGMLMSDVYTMLGYPDAEVWDVGRALDYDIDDDKPYTLRVELSADESTVAKVTTIRPFAFLHDTARVADY